MKSWIKSWYVGLLVGMAMGMIAGTMIASESRRRHAERTEPRRLCLCPDLVRP